jgi:hypothetical protein
MRHGFQIAFSLLVITIATSGTGHAQVASRWFELENPGRLNLRLLAAGYGSEKYGTTHAAFEVAQTITHAIGIVGRFTAYQVYQGTGFDSPLTPARRSSPRDFGRLQGGPTFSPSEGTTFTLLGGEDFGDSHAPVFENDFSTWIWLQNPHPMNLSYSTNHYFQNAVTNGLLDARIVLLSTGRVLLLAGVGGAIWGGGSVGQAKGQGGADIGFFIRQWRTNIDIQAGYGSSRAYGIVGFSRSFSFEE